MAASTVEILRSYRHLYRHGLHAVQYTVPARYAARDELRRAYRTGSATDFDAQKIENTIEFLHHAAKERGTAHRIVRTLMNVWWWRYPGRIKYAQHTPEAKAKAMTQDSLQHWNATIKMFNESMGLCLPYTDPSGKPDA